MLVPHALASQTHLFQNTFAAGQARGGPDPVGLAVDNSSGASAGDVYVTGGAVVNQYTSTSAAAGAAAPDAQLSAAGLEYAYGIAVDPTDGDVYVSNLTGGVFKFNAAGALQPFAIEGVSLTTPGGIAVDPTNGHVFLGDLASPKVYELTATGEFTGNTYVGEAGSSALAVDSAGHLYDANGKTIVFDTAVCTGECTAFGSLDEQTSDGVGVDPADGDVYVAEAQKVSEFDESGNPVGVSFGGSAGLGEIYGVGVDGVTGEVYVADNPSDDAARFGPLVALPEATTDPPTGGASGEATFHGEVNPDGRPLTECVFEYGRTETYGATAQCEPSPAALGEGSAAVPVQADVTGLLPGEYHLRLAATGENGSVEGLDRTLSVTGAPTFESLAITPSFEGAEFGAAVNPGNAPTTYHFEYGPSATYGLSTTPATLPAGTMPVHVTAVASGLFPSSTFHYRLVLENGVGQPVASGDRLFTTRTPETGQDCPPATEESPGYRTYLPDCRAYELAAPPSLNGGPIVGLKAVSADGSHLIAQSTGVFAGDETDFFDEGTNTSFNSYELTRTGTGWSAVALSPPAREFPASDILAVAENSALTPTLWSAQTSHGETYKEDIYLRTGTGEMHLVGPGIGPEVHGESAGEVAFELRLVGASSDLDHSVYSIRSFGSAGRERLGGRGNLWPGDTTDPGRASLYEFSDPAGPASEPLLVGVANRGRLEDDAEAELISACGTNLGSLPMDSSEASGSAFNALSRNGEVVFFTAAQCEGGPPANELYARVSGAETVPISEPSHAACLSCDTAEPAAAVFRGASADGSKVFFTSTQQLFEGARGEAGTNLYEYNFAAAPGHEAITLLASEVSGVARISDDGGRVYFVSTANLTHGPNVEGAEAQLGGQNLYLYQASSPGLAFVATLLTPVEEAAIEAAELSEQGRLEAVIFERLETTDAAILRMQERSEITEAEVAERQFRAQRQEENEISRVGSGGDGPSGSLRYDREVWSRADARPVQEGDEGRFLVFPSSADLTGEDPGVKVPQLFEYDASSARLTEASVGQAGSQPTTESFQAAPKLPPEPYERTQLPPVSRHAVVSESGAVFFTSSSSLTSGTTEGDTNVYEYRGGRLSLISDGHDGGVFEASGESAVELQGIDPTGSDVFFTSADQLVPEDAETQRTLYDAREGGGFPAPELAPACAGEACQAPSPPRPSSQGPSTANFSGPANPVECPKGKVDKNGTCVKQSAKKKSRKHHKPKKTNKANKRHAKSNRRAGR